MAEMESGSWRRSSLLSPFATVLLVAIGYAISVDMAASLIPAALLIGGALLLMALSPPGGIAAVILALPTMYQLHPMPRGEFSLLELAILVSAAGTGLHILDRIRERGLDDLRVLLVPPQVVVPVAMLLFATGIALLTLADPAHRTESLREVRLVIIEPLIFLATVRIVMRDPGWRNWVGGSFIVAGVVLAVYAMVQVAFDLGGVQAGSLTRATGPYPHPNNLAFFLERTALFTLAVAVLRPRWWPLWALGAVQLAGVGVTFSRGAFLAMAAGIAVLLLLRGMYKWLGALMACGVVVGGAALLMAPDRVIDAGGSGSEPTRFTIWRSSLRMAVDHPVFGVGPDQFLYQYWRRYVEPMGWPERYTSHPHNLLLDVWLRLGVAGLAAFATLAVGIVWWVKRMFGAIRDDVWAIASITALAGGLAHGMVDQGFFLPDLATMMWLFVAFLVSVRHQPASVPDRAEFEETWPDIDQPHVAAGRAPNDSYGVRLSLTVIAILEVIFGLLALPATGGATMAIVGLGVLLTVIAPPVMIALALITVPIQDAVLLPYFRGDLTLTQMAMLALVAGWGLTFWRYRVWIDGITMWFLAIGGAFLISLLAMDEVGLWAGEVYRWAIAAVFFIICRSVLRDWRSVQVVLLVVALSVLAISSYGAGQIIGYDGPEHLMRGGVLRVFGTFGTPNPFAAYIEFTVPMLLILALLGLQRAFRVRIGMLLWIISGMAAGTGLAMLTFTQSRGGMIGFSAAMAVVLWVLPMRLRLAAVGVGAAVLVLALLTPAGQSQLNRFGDVFAEPAASRTGSTYDYGTGRSSLWGAAIRMFDDQPLTGVGAGEFDYHYREYTPVWYDRFPRGQAHNGWLQMAAQAGVAGLVAFTGWVMTTLVSLIGAVRRSTEPLSKALALGALAVMIAFTVHSMVDYLNVLSLGLQISAVLAIGLNLVPRQAPISHPVPSESSYGTPPLETGIA